MNESLEELTLEELEYEGGRELPSRELLLTVGVSVSATVSGDVSLLGLPLLSL